jgi:hypothetical protein
MVILLGGRSLAAAATARIGVHRDSHADKPQVGLL